MSASRIAHPVLRIIALTTLLILTAVGSSSAGLLGIDSSYKLYDINISNGTPTNPRFVIDKVNMIAMSTGGTLYGVSQGFPTDVPPGGNLYTINVLNGFPTLIAPLDTFIVVEGDIAWDPVGNQLYGVDSEGMLLRINTSNGNCTILGDISSGNIDCSAMAFDASGNCWVVDSFGPTLLRVDKTNAAILQTVPLDPINQEVGGLAFHPGNGTLYHAAGYSSSALYTLNTTNGNAINLGPTISGGIWGLTFEPEPTPVEPATWSRIKTLLR